MELKWDQVGERLYETGVDHGVLYLPNNRGEYIEGHAWNGLTTVTESPSGAESNKQYADNQVYLNLISAEEFGGTIEAFIYPDAFEQCDGTAVPIPGVSVGQQNRRTFGFSYRTLLGNDLQGTDYGYKLHLVYGATASPSEKSRTTVNDSPEAVAFSWEISTTPVEVPGLKPSSTITIDSTKVNAGALSALEDVLYGTAGTDARLPLPAEVFEIMGSADPQTVTVTAPTYNATTKTITIPTVSGVIYEIDGETVTGSVVITEDTVVNARPAAGFRFSTASDDDFVFDF